MFDLPRIKKNIAPIIRREIQETEQRFINACDRVDAMIERDLTIPREDIQQAKWDLKKHLLNEIYQPYKDELTKMLSMINRFRDEEKSTVIAHDFKGKFDVLWHDMMISYDKSKWEDTDWRQWRKKWFALIVEGMKYEINGPREVEEDLSLLNQDFFRDKPIKKDGPQ